MFVIQEVNLVGYTEVWKDWKSAKNTQELDSVLNDIPHFSKNRYRVYEVVGSERHLYADFSR